MEKRIDRNKQLYKEVDKKIADIAKKKSNKDFENTNNTLKSINPNLFGGNENTNVNEHPKKSHKNLITVIIFSSLLVLIIGMAVVIYYATK